MSADAKVELVAQTLQDHMEQHHGFVLKASQWDAAARAAITALETSPNSRTGAMIDKIARRMTVLEALSGKSGTYADRDGEWTVQSFIAELTAMQAARPIDQAITEERYPHELRISFVGGKPVKAIIEGVEFGPIAPVQDDDALHDLPRLIELQRTAAPDCEREDGWNRGLERAAAMVREALANRLEKQSG